MAFSFTSVKDRLWRIYAGIGKAVFRLPEPLTRASFGGLGVILWLVHLVPGSMTRRAFGALSKLTDKGSMTQLFAGYVRKFTLATYRMEVIREGRSDEFAAQLRIPERARFDALVARGGVIFMMPHAHASVVMAEALGQLHPTLLFVRATKDDARAAWQREYYDKMTADVIDVRRADDVVASRTMLGALRKGHIVMGGGDFIKRAPKQIENKERDVVRVTAFGEPVGAMRWPARFAAKVNVPIVPITIEQGEDHLTLHMGAEITPGEIPETTQAWMDGMVELIRAYPTEWLFALDHHWRRVMTAARDKRAR